MLPHLLELRRRLLRVLTCFGIIFILFFFFATDLLHALISPLLKILPTKNALIATQLTSPLMTPLQLASDAAMLCTIPFLLYEIWKFIAPGLYRHERYPLAGLLVSSFALFIFGVTFCFFIILPWMLHFFAKAVPAHVLFMPDMTSATHFITHMLCIFGLAFQLPLLCLLLVKLGFLKPETLPQFRPYVIVAAFIIGMLLTPPDVLSQIMLAIPLCLLYELGVLLVRCLAK